MSASWVIPETCFGTSPCFLFDYHCMNVWYFHFVMEMGFPRFDREREREEYKEHKVQGATMNTDKMESRSPSSTDRSKQSVRRKPTLIENSGLCPVGWLAQIFGASPSPVAATSQSAP